MSGDYHDNVDKTFLPYDSNNFCENKDIQSIITIDTDCETESNFSHSSSELDHDSNDNDLSDCSDDMDIEAYIGEKKIYESKKLLHDDLENPIGDYMMKSSQANYKLSDIMNSVNSVLSNDNEITAVNNINICIYIIYFIFTLLILTIIMLIF